ncbi:MAG TPA: DnaJ domain-containing protein [Chloroflexota bacterium]|nr:DnaJ domain-containing protein [Chloroflexota bacterium]
MPRRPKRAADQDALPHADDAADTPPGPVDSPDNGHHVTAAAVTHHANGQASSESPVKPNGRASSEPPIEPSKVDPARTPPVEPKKVVAARLDPLAAANTPLSLESVAAEPASNALATTAPHLAPDPGLYAVLGLDPTAPDHAIQTSYRRQAARLLSNGATNTHVMRELNVAYEVLGNPVRRAEYDRMRLLQAFAPASRTPIRSGAKSVARPGRRTRPRHAVQPRYAGLGDVLVVLMVVGLAVLAGTLLIPRLSINLSALNALQNVLPLSNNSRRTIDVTPAVAVGAAATVAPTPTVRPGVAERFTGSSIAISDPTPAQNAAENVAIRLRRDGQPAANFDVWAVVQYRTAQERWPATGTQKTDATGAATITFNIGPATPSYPVTVRVFAQVDDQQLSWSTTFTPR